MAVQLHVPQGLPHAPARKDPHAAAHQAQQARLQQELQNARIAQAIYDLRTSAGLTQEQLAGYIGTSHTAISRLENADYNGHSLSMIRKIAEVFQAKVVIHFVPAAPTQRFLVAPTGSETRLKEVIA
ncbi:MAG: helix-turn-helix transcriptional regulator [candidate division Zixibacteria bacterium]|nr:helix-turn-helix transcriptional regulator [candidate division Zixibacteria bacterium]